MSLCIRQGSKENDWFSQCGRNLTGLHKNQVLIPVYNTSGVTVNADLEPKTHHQTPMTCTYGFSHFRHFQNCCNRDGNTIFKYMNYVPIVVATDLEVHFSVLKKGVSQYFCLYSVCTSHWCLVMSFLAQGLHLQSTPRGVKLGLGLGFMQTSQVLPHWLNQSFSSWTLSYTQRYCHVRIERVQNCCYNIRSTQFPRISLYALTLRFVLIEITKVVKPVH